MARQTETKTYVFRHYGEDEGWVAELTDKQAERIQKRLDKMEVRGEPPFYLYEMGVATSQEINAILTETKKELGL